jgi:hypothetical protein
MRLSRIGCILPALLAISLPATGQQSDADASIRALQSVLATHRSVLTDPKGGADHSAAARMEFTYKVNEWTGCRIKLTSSWKGPVVERRSVFDADLSLLSPQVEIQDGSTTMLTGVMVHTTSGQADILKKVIRGSDPKTQHVGTLAFMLSDRAFARTLARHLADAVTACGGKPRH